MRAGKYWAWIHWELDIPTFDMLGAKEILTRAWDESMNTQPAVITWTLMGMMNNCYFRCFFVIGQVMGHGKEVGVGERKKIEFGI